MKRLVLMRHAKSAWPEGVADFDRPLEARGREAAPQMALWLRRRGLRPAAVLCSTARRARETWALTAAALYDPGEAPEAVFRDDLYLASAESILEIIRHAAPAQAPSLLLIGHNEGLQEAARMICGARAEKASDARAFGRFVTAAMALCEFEGEWRDLEAHGARLAAYAQPKGAAL